ncbi:hypothetical protein [Diplocloster agilis]|uniref:Glycoside hydrolase family 2 n=1 Tax=Diplocloster agilis TaxID=2850323 RepID=A0A949NG12_9FIRM|nr:hypothetical protein [Diplocloster agilis]MBU9735858.1 hypothetical protein [Diplocloster agilis]
MLYSKCEKPLTEELFRNPTKEYRGAPFWSWNCRLDQEELLRQIDILHEMGFGGFHIHVRVGLDTPYLGKEYMDLIAVCAEKARKLGMTLWLYDEDRWPSGTAGGTVTKNPENRVRHLLVTRTPYGQGKVLERLAESKATSLRTENGRLLACYDIRLNSDGRLDGYKKVEEEEPVEGFRLYAYEETAEPNPWFNNQTYADTLNPGTVAEFLHRTHERYYEKFGKEFGGLIPAIFTDEPQFEHKTTLDFAWEDRDVILPWTSTLPESFQKAYDGEDLLAHIPELLWEPADGISRTRYLYHDHIAERFAAAFADQCGAWCEKHGLLLTGHMMEEPTLEKQTTALGETMRSYRSFQLPGIDMVCNWHEYTTAKQAQSVSRQKWAPGVMSEIYGVTNWDYDFRGYKLQGDWQAALGVTVRVPHLSWVSMNGESKRDYPGTFNYQAPWYDQFPLIEDHFARINTAMTRGNPVVHIGVIHPVESYWLHFGVRENTWASRNRLEKQFLNLTKWLLEGLQDFDFIAESLLPEQCVPEQIDGRIFPVGEMHYDVVIVPGCETLRSTTLDLLERFRDLGGRVIFLGAPPKFQDAIPTERGRNLSKRCERGEFESTDLMDLLEGVRELDIRTGTGERTQNLIYQLREEKDNRWLFIAHSKDPDNKDLVCGDVLRIRIRGEWYCTKYDTQSGEIEPFYSLWQEGWTQIHVPFYDHDSLMLKLTKEQTGTPREYFQTAIATPVQTTCIPKSSISANSGTRVKRWLYSVPVTLEEPNVLLLDMAEYRLDEEEYRPMEEILRLDNILRREIGWPLRMEAFAQPYVEKDASTPHVVGLRFTFHSRVIVKNTRLALEREDLAEIRLNNELLEVETDGWYVDRCIRTVPMPDIFPGKNVLEISWRYGCKVDLEAVYLLGDFGVEVAGCCCTLTEPVKKLAFGDITRQGLPFYGGNLVYHLETNVQEDCAEMAVTSYRGQLLHLSVNGEPKGHMIYSPYRLPLNGLRPGIQKIDIRLFGNRVNTFGQLHCNNRDRGLWWGPNSWRTDAEEWTYEYRFRRQGILKSPELFLSGTE